MNQNVAQTIMDEDFQAFPPDVAARINLGPKARPAPMARAIASTVGAASPPVAPRTSNMIIGDVPNPPPGFTNPVSESEAISISLSSRFAFYDFKDLYVRPFRVRQLAKLNKAQEDSSLLHMVEAVSSVLSTSTGIPNLGFKLCVADFYHVLYWLRLHSFTKNTILHQTVCTNENHMIEVTAGRQPESTLKLSQIVSNSNIVVHDLETIPDPEHFKLAAPGWYLRPATMQDTLEFTEHPDWLDPEFQYLAKLASNISCVVAEGQPEPTLIQKVEVIQDWAPSESALVAEFEKLLDGFGVDETVVVHCKWCGASRESKIILDAHSFLSAE